METKHRVFIVDDHQLFREGLKSMLDQRENIEIVGEADYGLKAIRKIREAKPDLVLLDLSVNTVEKHRADLIAKIDRHNIAELTAYAVEKGLVKMET